MGDNAYVGVRIEGGLLPSSLLARLVDAKGAALDGMTSADYGLAHGETVREAANRVWAYLRTVWAGYRSALVELPKSERATTLTRERWLMILLDQLGFGRLPAGRGIEVDGKRFPASHAWGPVPIHLLGARIDLDRRTAGVAGAAGQAPQSMVQELLNRSDDHLWAILSNGSTLRLLRDSTSLVGSAYVEFDLEAIFDGELFSDFLVMYALIHATRFAVRDESIGADSCWLEAWRERSVEAGSRALDQLRVGVVEAIEALGTGFLSHPANVELRAKVEADEITLVDFNHALLRVIYRLLFTFVAEDRGVLLDPEAEPLARQRYADYFSTQRLRVVARKRRGGRHGDRWQALNVVWTGLGNDCGRPELGLVGIGGLYEDGPLDFLVKTELTNETLLKAVRAISLINEKASGLTRVVDYRSLDSEELGSIYEALLEYVPQWDAANRRFQLASAAGNSRKTTGSYYTPAPLIDTLLDSALDPVIAEVTKGARSSDDAVAALLRLTVCDPACGSGHFLVGAARRIAKAVAAARTGDPEPPPKQVRSALREVIGACIYGVDINPLAAELAKVSLWLEAMEPGRPLTFLDAQIKVGNSLIGATPTLLETGLPQEAFKPIEGDDKKVVSALAKRNKDEVGGQGTLLDADEARISNAGLAADAARLGSAGASLADVHVQQHRLRNYVQSDAYRSAKLDADAWCAAFVWPKTSDAVICPTNATLDAIREGDIDDGVRQEVERLAAEYRFFHWHIEFPHLFPTERPDDGGAINPVTGWYGGFSVVVGNPPWEQTDVDAKTFFEAIAPEISAVKLSARRKEMIEALRETQPRAVRSYEIAKERAARFGHFAQKSGRLAHAAVGRINLYRLFAQTFDDLCSDVGRVGIIVPTGIVTDLSSSKLCRRWVERGGLDQVADFINKRGIFVDVKRPVRFCLLTLTGRSRSIELMRTFLLAEEVVDLKRADRWVSLNAELVLEMNPETATLPLFRDQEESSIAERVYSDLSLFRDVALTTKQGFVNMTSDSRMFRTQEELGDAGARLDDFARFSDGLNIWWPVMEAKLFDAYNVSSKTFDGVPPSVRFNTKASPTRVHRFGSKEPLGIPRYWVPESWARSEWPSARAWVLAGKEVTDNKTSSRTSVFAPLPRIAASYTCQLVFGDRLSAEYLACLLGQLNSLVFDFFARQKISGSHLTASILRQLPVLSPEVCARPVPWAECSASSWLAARVAALANTTIAVSAFVADVGASASRFAAQDEKRIRAEIDAACMHLFGLSRSEVEFVLDSFVILRRMEFSAVGEYRTRRLVLDSYDRIAEAIVTGTTYCSPFDEESQ